MFINNKFYVPKQKRSVFQKQKENKKKYKNDKVHVDIDMYQNYTSEQCEVSNIKDERTETNVETR